MLEKKRFFLPILLVTAFIATISLCGYFLVQSLRASHHEDVVLQTTKQFSFNASPFIPQQVLFADEKVPIDIYWVRENLDKELVIISYQHSLTMLSLKRSKRFFPVIEPILKKEGVPDDFKYLCVAESGLQNVISPAKATGFWQFIESTGKQYGLEINSEVDERYHLEKSTRAACQYLKDLKSRLGSWTLAAAAYNMGEAGLKKNMNLQQRNVYYELLLNQETARYIYRIVAYKLVFEQPSKYNFWLEPAEFYYPIPYNTIHIDSSIADFYLFAQQNNITYREFKELNPWLRNSSLTVKHKQYEFKIPSKSPFYYQDLLPKE